MAYENLCMYCFEDMQGQTTCPHCGRDSRAAVPQVQMLPGSLVYHDRFLIGRALGQDASGIVYAAFDTKKENRLRIREYLPRDCAERLNDGAVVPVAGKEDEFDAGIKKLRASVESVEDPRKRHFFFEENGTAYIAQRKSASAAQAREDDDEAEDTGNSKRVLLFAGIAVAVLVVAAILLITVFNGALNTTRDLTQTPTLDPNQVWIPAATPTATPYVAPTFAALVDPELSWMEYTYEGDVEQEYQQAQRAASTPTPTPAPTIASGGSNKYKYISGNSSKADIRALQQRLADLGWLEEDQVTGKYDAATRQAVKDFQSYINERYNPKEKLAVDGSAGPKTQQWLYEVGSYKPTPTPAPKVTPKADDKTVDENASAEKIRDVQQKLITLGLLPEGSADGAYGATTSAAVRRFQQRVNQLQGYDVLNVTGKMDPQSMAFLNYYAEEWAKLRQATAVPTATPAPTAVPTPTPTTRPVETLNGVIDANSPAEAVRKVQLLLIDIGMMPAGSADGKYGSATIAAVADFQQWVNLQRDEQTLPVNGEVDQLTLAYMQYCKDHGLTPYGTPAPAATTQAPTATPAPTAAPEPEGDSPVEDDSPEEEGDIVVDVNSDRESIRYVQQMLAAVGAMSESGVDGVYGRGTTRAVQAFQEWVNQTQGAGTLEVSGVVDNATRLALEYAYDHDLSMTEPTEAPTEAPTPAPTEAPTEAPTQAPEPDEPEGGEIVVDANSDPESIRYVQQMLGAVGAMSGGETGVYDDATVEAVKRFQAWVNSVQGSNTLPVTGQVDDRTRQALEYAYDHGYAIENAPSDGEGEPQGVGAVGDVDIRFGEVLAGDSVISVPEGPFSVEWRAEGDVDSYYIYVTDGDGNPIVTQEATDATSFNVDTKLMNPGEIYKMRLGVLPARGGEGDIVWREVRFTLPQRETPTPEPTETPEPEPTVASVGKPRISIAGQNAEDGPVIIEGDTFQVSWTADGDVTAYQVRITGEDGGEIASQTTDQMSVGLRADNMREGVMYTLTVGAIPAGGTEADMVVSSARFTRPEKPTPEPTPTASPTPAPTPASIGKPVINLGGTAVQHDGVPYMTDSSIIISWNADGDVAGYYVYVENQSGEQHELSSGTDTSSTVSTASLPAGVYTVYVGALPVNGTRDDAQWSSTRFGIPSPTAEPTQAPTATPEAEAPTPQPTKAITEPISAASDAETIQQLQLRLYSLGLLSVDAEPGVLDQMTLQAVYEFQTRLNEQYGLELPVIDPTDPSAVVDVTTVQAIFTDFTQGE